MFYPIGTVVLLEGGTKEVMICGRSQENKETKEYYDYSACLYPEGIISSDRLYLFQQEDIRKVIFVGFESEKEKELKEVLEEHRKNDKF